MLERLEGRRAERCRLDPRRALGELDDAAAFLHERGMLTLTPCCALPSLFGACHEEPYSDKGGFASYPKTRWWWGGALAAADGVLATKLHAGKTLFLAPRVADVVSSLCLEALDEARAGQHGPDAARVVELLEQAGPSTTDEVKTELGLDARGYQRARAVLDKRGAILTRTLTVDTDDDGHRHMSELRLWDHAPTGPREAVDTLTELLVAAVDAAVVLSERDARRAFTWTIPTSAVDAAVDEGRVVRPAPNVLASAEP
jgi:hypothetical protein